MWLTLATFVGYAIVYTVLLKPATPQNIVIGGASGAMPPVLGWAAVTNDVAPEALLLFLIIFVWTPPHFWSLALYRAQDYAKGGAADAAGDARAPLYAAHDRALHGRAGRGHAAAVRGAHERPRLPCRRARAGRRSSCCYAVHALPRLQRRAGARDVQILGVVPGGAVLGTARSTTTFTDARRYRSSRRSFCMGNAGRRRLRARGAEVHGVRCHGHVVRPRLSVSSTTTARRARWPTIAARPSSCSSVIRNAPISARPRSPSWRRR